MTATPPDALRALPVAEFAFPGPLRDQLVAAIRSGAKTSTTGTLAEYRIDDEPLPVVGGRSAVVDSAGDVVAVIETTAVTVLRLAEVDLQHARDEGEGFDSVAAWREDHERFWRSAEMREAMRDPGFDVDDGTAVVAKRFRLVERVDPPLSR